MSRRFILPLRVREIKFTRSDSGYDIESAEGMEICRMAENCDSPEVNLADAEAIVKAVNHYDDLVATVSRLAKIVEAEYPPNDPSHEEAVKAFQLLEKLQ